MDPHLELDEQTARLIAQLQLEDLNEMSSNAKVKHPEDRLDDFDYALAIYENDLKAVADREMAQSIAHAVRADGQLIKHAIAEEQQASQDRRMALEALGTAAPAFPMIEGGAVNDVSSFLMRSLPHQEQPSQIFSPYNKDFTGCSF